MGCLFLLTNGLVGQQTISEVKAMPFGSVITTTGTLSCGDEFGLIRYMQDADAGIALYDADLSATQAGDSIVVTGVLSRYRGQTQLSPVFSFNVVGKGKELSPLVLDQINAIDIEAFLSRKVIFTCGGIASCEASFAKGFYKLYDQFGWQARLLISEALEDEHIAISTSPYAFEGIWTKFEDQYELLGQNIADASEGSCHLIPPAEIAFDSNNVVLTWNDLSLSPTFVQYGEQIPDMVLDTNMVESTLVFRPDDLEEGKLYFAVLAQLGDGGEVYSSIPTYFSAPSTTRPIEILFNRSVNTSFSDGSAPLATGSSVIQTDLIERIDQVSATLEIAMYNTTRSAIVQAVNRAVDRGVTVRYIVEEGNSNTALDGVQSFPILYRTGNGIMHNKFVVADADDPEKAWLWAGSTNFTTNQLSTDPNHAYIIHDQSLAQNYRKEFNEMWGSVPSQPKGRNGDFKVDNTAHILMSNHAVIESYFSPSDETACHMLDALQTTNYQVQIGLLLLTHFELIDEIIALYQSGIDVRVILDDEDSSESALAQLRQANVPVAIHDPGPIFHHKYAIIDEGYPDSDPQVVTGSHNWTWSADNINDENTLIIHDQSVTNIFRQEFEARWEELNPTSVTFPNNYSIQLVPNPASSFVKVQLPDPVNGTIDLLDIQGQLILSSELQGQNEMMLNINQQLPSGYYLLQVRTTDHVWTSRLVIL